MGKETIFHRWGKVVIKDEKDRVETVTPEKAISILMSPEPGDEIVSFKKPAKRSIG